MNKTICEFFDTSVLPLIWLRPMYDEDAMPDEIASLRSHFSGWGLRRLPDLEHEEIWGFFDEKSLHAIWLELSRWGDSEIPGYATAWLAVPAARQPSALVDELLSLGYFSCATHYIAVEGFPVVVDKINCHNDIQHFGIPRKEDLLAWGMRKTLSDVIAPASIKPKL